MKQIKAIVQEGEAAGRAGRIAYGRSSAAHRQPLCTPSGAVWIRSVACTGNRGDGVLSVSNVDRVVKIRTGDEGILALL